MRINVATRIFLALTLLSLAILALNATVTRWSFDRDFLNYVASQEADTLSSAASRLAGTYRQTGNWDTLRNRPRLMMDIVRPNERPPPVGERPDLRRGPRGEPGRPESGDPPPRLALLDADGNVVVGPAEHSMGPSSMAITVNGNTVGFISLIRPRRLTNPLDQEFAKNQGRSIYLIATGALLIAALVSALLAAHLTRPIKALAAGAKRVSRGKFDTRISAERADELGDLARDFNQLASTLEKNRSSRQRWVADIAHELRTPLAILRGELDAIEDGIRTFDTATQKSLQAEVDRLTALVRDLHELSIYDEGALDCRQQSTDLTALVSRMLEMAGPRLQEAGISVIPTIAENIVIFADAARLEQLLLNLIENTLRYTDTPGSLKILCRLDEPWAVIEFDDTAPGVPPQMLERVFDRLFRVDESRSRRAGGSGLGLSICKAIAEAHGGSIEALESNRGGLRLRVRLPATTHSRSIL